MSERVIREQNRRAACRALEVNNHTLHGFIISFVVVCSNVKFMSGILGLAIPIFIVLVVPSILFLVIHHNRKQIPSYNLDPKGEKGAFEPLLQKYLRLAEFMIGLATGSIVLLVGSSVLHGKDVRLPPFYRLPLVLLAGSVLWGLLFMVYLILSYEDWQHGNPHTARAYAWIESLGFTSLLLFFVGYLWLIVVVTA